MIKIISFFIILIIITEVCSEFYSSNERLLHLNYVDKKMIELLQNYHDNDYQKIEFLERFVTQLGNHHKMAEANGYEEYLNNPINLMILFKRITVDWVKIHEMIAQLSNNQKIQMKFKELHEQFQYPTEFDLNGAVFGIEKLRQIYELNVTEIANGNLNGVEYGTILKWKDCLEIGLHIYDDDNKESAIPWFEEALRRRGLSNVETDGFSNTDIMEYIASAYENIGNIKKALNVTNEILKLEKNNRFALANKEMLQGKMFWNIIDQINEDPINPFLVNHINDENDMNSIYKQICRKTNVRSASKIGQLHCRYETNGAPYRILGPFKFEEMNLEPLLGVYHNVLSIDDVEIMKNLAKPLLVRNTLAGPNDSKAAHYRTSQGATFDYHSHPVLMKVHQIIGDASGLDMNSAESIQISNYGIGGNYGPHFDFFSNDLHTEDANNLGDRIATAMFYLSEVDQGGATAFVNLRTGAWPETGSLVFWYNLHRSGNPDYRTLHASCPVIKGSKWIANVWIRSRGQEFRRPCNVHLEEDDFSENDI